MADEKPIVPAAEAPVAAAPAPVPVVEAPIAAAAVEAAPTPAPVPEAASAPAPVVEAAPAAEVAPAPAPVVEAKPTDQPTLFEKFEQKQAEAAEKKPVEAAPEGEKKADEKPADEKADGEKPEGEKAAKPEGEAEKKAEAAPEPVKREPIKFEYALPENVKLPEPQKAELDTILNDFVATPTPEVQQKLIDFHFARLTDAIKDYDRQAHQTFADVRDKWGQEVMKDPEIGGNNHEGAMQAVAYVRDNFVSLEPRGSKQYDEAKKGFDQFLHYTGAGDNPWFLRFVHNVSTVVNEGPMQATSDIKPIVQTDNGGRAPIYRHPTSQRNGR